MLFRDGGRDSEVKQRRWQLIGNTAAVVCELIHFFPFSSRRQISPLPLLLGSAFLPP
jgi:hypothetical protein